MTMRFYIALVFALAVLPARADSYKWIDSKGRVNYSNAPPPSALQLMQLVEDRISVIGEDPSTRDAVARMEARLEQQRQYEAQDWLQRQRAMVLQRGTPTMDCGYGGYCGDNYASSYYSSPQFLPAYYSPYFYGGRVINAFVPRPVHLQQHTQMHTGMSRPHSGSHSRGSGRR